RVNEYRPNEEDESSIKSVQVTIEPITRDSLNDFDSDDDELLRKPETQNEEQMNIRNIVRKVVNESISKPKTSKKKTITKQKPKNKKSARRYAKQERNIRFKLARKKKKQK